MAWVTRTPDIDDFVGGIDPEALPTLLMELSSVEYRKRAATGDDSCQVVKTANTPELQAAVAEGRHDGSILMGILAVVRDNGGTLTLQPTT